MIYRKPVAAMVMIALLALLPARAGAGPVERGLTPAEADSLVWYVEELEADLKICEIRGSARSDSLALRLEFMGQRLEWALEDQPRWYEKPTLAFMAGAVLAMIILGQIVKITF